MSSIPVSQELELLVGKYADVSTPIDILRAFAHHAKLAEANILLHERLARDVYSIFGKSEEGGEMTSETGQKLLNSSKVTRFHHADSLLVFHTEAEVEFNMGVDKASSKRKRCAQMSTAIDEPVIIKYQFSEQTLGAGSGTSPGSAKREKGVTVLEAPYKSINLIITMRRGCAGLDQTTVVDFQLLTSGCSPSAQRISLQELMGKEGGEGAEDSEGSEQGSDERDSEEEEGSEGECGAEEGEEGSEDEDHCFEGEEAHSEGEGVSDAGSEEGEGGCDGSENSEEENDEEGESEEGDGIDAADYYNVNVCTDSLAKLKNWLGFRSLQEQQDEEEEEERLAEEERQRAKATKSSSSGKKGSTTKGKKQQVELPTSEQSESESEAGSEEGEGGEPSPYEQDPALGDLLQFLLSLPYVDEAWSIHDLILDHELGANGEGQEEEGSDEVEYCMPCCQ